MVGLDYFLGDTAYTSKLDVPDGLQVTNATVHPDGWVVIGSAFKVDTWVPFGAAIPAILLYLLLFMETHICEYVSVLSLTLMLHRSSIVATMHCEVALNNELLLILLNRLIMLEKTKGKKGGGLHWDIVLLCGINCLGTFVGGPWICAATVRAVSHVSALTVMSTTHAPGEAPSVVDVRGNINFK
jgi:hypothetical protein